MYLTETIEALKAIEKALGPEQFDNDNIVLSVIIESDCVTVITDQYVYTYCPNSGTVRMADFSILKGDNTSA